MGKVFEDYLAELQVDMVAICLEYVEDKAEDIFIYCSYEPKVYAFDVFYKINGNLVLKHNLNDAIDGTGGSNKYDTSEERQEAMLDIGLKNLKEINKTCEDFGRQMPTEIKLHYNVSNNSLKASYKYDLIYSNHNDLMSDDIFDDWFEEVNNSIY
ncbi:hypothetical protein N781_08670 [Pontibacillus halophilus JSM 076056 = DSM 19796]|uniref:DUF600 domain-containing protein n=1 Tax=Pontibacillus halophilus JSM 076056 = DSM 19796 TaxID=1385510 RepID=A0A0A5G9W2_9BACI|nr:hypothetical protein [Pontibacillus halophilus]KGX89951.1 hypothetical protein N781_08670 [Pontibacillus halophilus JSM 076056 = DSM 19796]